ncbi:hypothetical protein [Psychromonas sp. MB-3u-54]|nr:hypothetical protein [Psychromonas sp. MB-3u-54]
MWLSMLKAVAVTFYMPSKKTACWDWGFYAGDKNGFNKEAVFI